jgi:hypothetical protein
VERTSSAVVLEIASAVGLGIAFAALDIAPAGWGIEVVVGGEGIVVADLPVGQLEH